MLQNARLTAFTVSELLRENQKGAEEISEHEQCQFLDPIINAQFKEQPPTTTREAAIKRYSAKWVSKLC